MKQVQTLALYKVKAQELVNSKFAAASNQMEAIENVYAFFNKINRQNCSVSHIGMVYIKPMDIERMAALEEENARLTCELEIARLQIKGKTERDPMWLPTFEQINSVFAAANILRSMNEETASNHLMALLNELKVLRNRYYGIDIDNVTPPSFEESQGESGTNKA